MSNPGTPDTGALSIDQAVAALALPKKEPEAPAEAAAPEAKTEEQPNPPAEPTAEDAQGAETPPEGEAETEQAAEAEGEKPEQPALEPPKFWDAEAKKRFGELPRDVQEIVLKKEDERNAATAKALQQSAEKAKALEAESANVTRYVTALSNLLPRAEATFKGRWDNVDWNAVVDQYGADQALKLRNQMDAEKEQLQQLQAAKQVSDQAEQAKFRAERMGKFQAILPELADPKLGPKRQEELVEFVAGAGIDRNWVINNASAEMLAIAADAMKWRNGQAQAKRLVEAPKPPPAVKKTPVKPTGTAPQGSPQQIRLTALSRKKELTIDEAVELANLKGSQAA